MKKISLITLTLILSLALCMASVISSFAEEVFELPEIADVAEEELTEDIGEEVELFADASTAVCYIGEDEASRVYYDTLYDATHAAKGATVYLIKNATWEDTTTSGNYGIHHVEFTIEGNGHTITLGSGIHVSLNSEFILNNVTIDLDTSHSFVIGANGILTLGNGTTVTNGNRDVSLISIANRGTNGGTFNMKEGSLITNCTSTVLGIIYVDTTGTVNIEGEITGNKSPNGAIRLNASTPMINIGKTANITGNKNGSAEKNIVLNNANQLTVASDFEGTIGISYGSAGSAFGTVEDGADVSGIILDGTTTVATNKNGVLTWETEEEAAAKNAVCYINENTEGNRYASLDAAIKAASSGSTIYVVKNITLDITANTNYEHKVLTITSDGGKKTITVTGGSVIFKGASSVITLDNIAFDFAFSGKNFRIDDGATVYLVGSDILNGNGGVGGTVAIGSGTRGNLVMDENSTISGHSTESTAGVGGVVHLHGASGMSSFTMNGGKIINYNTTLYAVSQWNTNSTITIGGNATIENGQSAESTPVTGTKNAINLKNATSLILKGDFTGDIRVNYGSIGDKFGTAEEGATISGLLTNYSTGKPAAIKNGNLIWDYACYVGTDVAANRYYSLNEALRGIKSTVYMVRDAEWDPALDTNTGTMANLVTTLNGNGYTMTPTKDIRIAYSTKLTFEDVTVDMNGKNFKITDGAEITLNDGAHFINGGSGLGQGGTFTTWDNHDVTITMNEGSYIKNSKAEYGGAMLLAKGAKFIMNGGEISNNWAKVGKFGGGIKVNAGASVTVSGNAKIEGNKSGVDWNTAMEDNLLLASPNELTVNDGFTGHIGIWYEANNAEGKAVGKAGTGLTSLPSVTSITNDANNYHFGWIDAEGNIEWQAKPTITTTLQYGTYSNGEKGIIRLTNSFEDAPVSAKITAFGTYVLDNSSFSESDLAATENKFVKTETSVLASGKGFITDIHTGNLAKSYTASSFCYIEGIEAPVFTTISADAINSADGVIELSDEAVAGYESLYEN